MMDDQVGLRMSATFDRFAACVLCGYLMCAAGCWSSPPDAASTSTSEQPAVSQAAENDKAAAPSNDNPAASAAAEEPEVSNVAADDWAFLPQSHSWPERFAFLDPRASLDSDSAGVHAKIEPPLVSMLLVYRKRLVGDFKMELQLDIEPSPNFQHFPGMPPTMSQSLTLVGFRTNADQPDTKFLTLPRGLGVTSEGVGPNKLVVERKGGIFSFDFGDQHLRKPIAAEAGSGYLVLQMNAPAKLTITRAELTGETDHTGYAAPQLTAAKFDAASWRGLSNAGRDSAKDDEMLFAFDPAGVRIDNLVRRGSGQARYNKELDGDLYIRAKVVAPAPAPPSSSGGPPSARNAVSIPISCGIASAGSRRMCAIGVRIPGATSHAWITLVRHGEQMWETCDGIQGSSSSIAGPAFFHVNFGALGPVRIEELAIFSQSLADVPEPPAPSLAADGWKVDTDDHQWREDHADRISVMQEGNRVLIVTKETGSPVPILRRFPVTGDFEATWKIVVPPLEFFAGSRTRGGQIFFRVRPDQPPGSILSFQLPHAVEGKTSEHVVTIRRESDQVTLTTGSQKEEGKIPGSFHLEVAPAGRTHFWIADYKLEVLSNPAGVVTNSEPTEEPDAPIDVAGDSNQIPATASEIKLPAPADKASLAGGGRYLLLQSKQINKLIIFDLESRKIVKLIALDGSALFAGGAEHLVTLHRETRVLSRYHLTPFERELSVAMPEGQTPVELTLGAGSAGPILVTTKDQSVVGAMSFIDLRTLKPIDVPINTQSPLIWRPESIVRASADGRLFAFSSMPSALITLWDNKVELTPGHAPSRLLLGPMGKYIYTDKGIHNSQLQPISERADEKLVTLPATQGPFYLELEKTRGKDPRELVMQVHVRVADRTKPVMTVDKLRINQDLTHVRSRGLPIDCRVVYHPPANAVVALAESNDRLQFYDIDPEESLRKSPEDFFLVVSQPPATARAGEKYKYAIKAISHDEPLKYELTSGPEGLSVSATGVVSWDVPADATGRQEHVIVTLSNKRGDSIFHTFAVRVAWKPKIPAVAVAATEPIPGKEEPKEVEPPITVAPVNNEPPKKETIRFPAPYDRVKLGGSGRYLIFNLRSIRKLAVLDLHERKVVKYLDVGNLATFAAGADMIVVLLPAQKVLQRWDLKTFKLDSSIKLETLAETQIVAMGSASQGPVLVGGGKLNEGRFELFDLETLKPINLTLGGGSQNRRFEVENQSRVRVSADGRVFTMWKTRSSPGGFFVMVVDGSRAQVFHQNESVGHITPNDNGSRIYTTWGIYSPDLRPLGDNPRHGATSFPVPAIQSDYYVKIDRVDTKKSHEERNQKPSVSIHLTGHDGALITLPKVDMPGGEESDFKARGRIALDQRIYFAPHANVLATLPVSNDTVVLRELNLEQELTRAGIDYLFVASRPPARIVNGESFQYQLNVKSRRGEVRCSLAAGPSDMQVTAEGHVTWKAKQNDANPRNVIIAVTDASGQEMFHAFKLTVEPGVASPAANGVASTKPSEPPPDPARPEMRTWTDATGKFKVKAKFLRRDGKSVYLVREDGREAVIEVARLSEADQTYVTERTKAAE